MASIESRTKRAEEVAANINPDEYTERARRLLSTYTPSGEEVTSEKIFLGDVSLAELDKLVSVFSPVQSPVYSSAEHVLTAVNQLKQPDLFLDTKRRWVEINTQTNAQQLLLDQMQKPEQKEKELYTDTLLDMSINASEPVTFNHNGQEIELSPKQHKIFLQKALNGDYKNNTSVTHDQKKLRRKINEVQELSYVQELKERLNSLPVDKINDTLHYNQLKYFANDSESASSPRARIAAKIAFLEIQNKILAENNQKNTINNSIKNSLAKQIKSTDKVSVLSKAWGTVKNFFKSA
jgi:hypothetical protein